MAVASTDPREIAARTAEIATQAPWIELAVLFGSSARERLRPESDVDVAWLGASPSDAAHADLLATLEQRLGRDVHLVDLRTASDLLRIEIVRSGLLAFERRPGAWNTFAAESMSRWFDIEPLVRVCAEAVRRRAMEGEVSPRG